MDLMIRVYDEEEHKWHRAYSRIYVTVYNLLHRYRFRSETMSEKKSIALNLTSTCSCSSNAKRERISRDCVLLNLVQFVVVTTYAPGLYSGRLLMSSSSSSQSTAVIIFLKNGVHGLFTRTDEQVISRDRCTTPGRR